MAEGYLKIFRAYSIMDSSRVSTFLISILLIVYGSFRSLNMEQEAREREKEKERTNLLSGLASGTGTSDCANGGSVQTLDTMHALCLPLGASISLLIMFFFFDSMQMLFAICTASKSLKTPIFTFLFLICFIVKSIVWIFFCQNSNELWKKN